MRIAEVIGNVTLSRAHESLPTGRLLLAIPIELEELKEECTPNGEEVVVFDAFGAGMGQRIAISEGREAAMPFYPEKRPVDAYCACILDQINV